MKIKYTNKAFALPVVMIASVVMMMVLVSGLSATTSVNSGLRQQHDAKLLNQAAQSGLAMANACMKANSGAVTWTVSSPLKPNTDCSGTETRSCPSASTDSYCYVSLNSRYRTSFIVELDNGGPGGAVRIKSNGFLNLTVSSSGAVRSSSSTTRMMTPTSPAAVVLSNAGVKQNTISAVVSPNQCAETNTNGCTYQATTLCGVTTSGEVYCAGYDTLPYSSSYSYGGYTQPLIQAAAGLTCLSGSTYTSSQCNGSNQATRTLYLQDFSTNAAYPFYGKEMASISAVVSPNQCAETYSGNPSGCTYQATTLCGTTKTGEVYCTGYDTTPYSSSFSYGEYTQPLIRANTGLECQSGSTYTESQCSSSSSARRYYLQDFSTNAAYPFYGKEMGSPQPQPANQGSGKNTIVY